MWLYIMHKLIVSIILLVLIVMVVPRGYTEIVEDGLVGYWSFDQIVGKTVKDGLKKHDGAISKGNIKSANNGKIGKALLFDGEPDFVEIDGANDFIANADFTWCAWIKTKEDLGGIVAKTPSEFDTDAQGAKTFFLNAGTLTFDTGWVGVINGLKTVNDDKWHYVAVLRPLDYTYPARIESKCVTFEKESLRPLGICVKFAGGLCNTKSSFVLIQAHQVKSSLAIKSFAPSISTKSGSRRTAVLYQFSRC
jgi:hypothetical protein